MGACRSHQELRDEAGGVAGQVCLEVAWITITITNAKTKTKMGGEDEDEGQRQSRSPTGGSRWHLPGLTDIETMPRSAYLFAIWRARMAFPCVTFPVPIQIQTRDSPSAACSHGAQGTGTFEMGSGKGKCGEVLTCLL